MEGAEAYRITLNDATGYVVGDDVTADGTLNDGTAATPAAPTGLMAKAGNTQMSLSWTDPDDASINGYQYRKKKGSAAWETSWTDISGSDANTTSHTVTGLDNNVRYRFRIRARNSGGDSPDSNTATATPQALGVTLSKTELTVNEGSTGTYTVKLNTDPGGNVTVTPTSADSGAVSVSPGSLTFNSSKPWSTAQTVIVTGESDADTGNENITHSVSGYTGVTNEGTVAVTVTDTTTAAVAPVLTAATSTTSQQVSLTWTHAGTGASDLASGATSFTSWQASARLKGGSTWRDGILPAMLADKVLADKDDPARKQMEKLLPGKRLIIETLFDKLKQGAVKMFQSLVQGSGHR